MHIFYGSGIKYAIEEKENDKWKTIVYDGSKKGYYANNRYKQNTNYRFFQYHHFFSYYYKIL